MDGTANGEQTLFRCYESVVKLLLLIIYPSVIKLLRVWDPEID